VPILEVEVVLRPGESLPAGLARELADRAGEAFDSAPGGTWVRVRALAREQYAENGGVEGMYPVFVSVLKARLPTAWAMQAEISRLTALIARACARPPENVHIFYQPAGMGRVAFGGKLIQE
jgi:phenylpyruvate tautomerase PptA (4-oxalocrotonate tautomerase family)